MAKTKQKLEKEIKELQSLLKDKGIVGEDRETLQSALTHLEKQHKEWKDEPVAPKVEQKKPAKNAKSTQVEKSDKFKVGDESNQGKITEIWKLPNGTFQYKVRTQPNPDVMEYKEEYLHEKFVHPIEKKKTFRVFGTEFHLDEDNCDLGEDLRKAFAARKEASKATKKRTVSITKKIAGKIVAAVETAIKDVAASEIKADPKGFEKDANKMVDAAEKLADAISEFMGDDFKDNQAASEFKEIHKLVAELVKKHKK